MKSSPVLKPAKSHATTSSSPPRPAIPDVPPNSWYAQRYADAVNTPISEIHSRKRGDILFATQPFMAEVCSPQMPANHQRTNSTTSFRSDADDGEDGSSAASPLFPSSTQPQLPTATCSNVQVGRDLLYVLGCLTNTSLFTEYNWRRRCAYKKEVEKGMVPLPELIQRQKMAQRKHLVASAGQNGAVEDEMLVTAEQYERGLNEAYNCPPKEMRVGVKLFVNDELVPDHYPGLHALPQCTATLDSVEVFRHWVAVPLVLIGYLNHFTLDRISISRTLSLTFVEHLLQMNRSSHSGTTSDANISSKMRSRSPSQQQGGGGASTREHNLRVELVYGCRSEGFFCTDFISRGSCTFTLAQSSKPALKAYEESLRQLIQARRSAATIFLAPRPSSTSVATKKPIATCRNCGHPLIYRCSICAAELCGRLECVRRNVRGYPRGCAEHEAQERRRVSQTPAS